MIGKQAWRILAVATVLTTPSALAQNVLVVGPAASPTTDFTSVQAAINAANPGDTIVVRSGQYDSPQITITKPLTLLGDPGATLMVTAIETILIEGIPAGTSCTIQGLRMFSDVFGPVGGRVIAENCEGLIHLRDIEGAPSSLDALGGRSASAFFRDCSQFHVHNVSGLEGLFHAERSRGSFSRQFGRRSVFAFTDSQVTLDRCDLSNDGAFIGSPFVQLLRTTCAVSRSSLEGGGLVDTALVGSDSTLLIDPTSTFSGTPAISGTMLTTLNTTLTTLTCDLSASGDLQLDLQGDTGDSSAILLGFSTAAQPTAFGDLWIDPVDHIVVQSGVLSSRESFSTIELAAGIPDGLQVVLQAITVGSELRLSNGVAMTLR